MSIGSKIKALRKKRGMTQAALSSGIVTRGMLSQIESGKSMPSMNSLRMLAERLDVSPSFLIEDGEDLMPAEYARIVKNIEKEYRAKNYLQCLDLFSLWQIETDEKFLPIFAVCAFETAKIHFNNGEFKSAIPLLEKVRAILPNLLISPKNVSQKQVEIMISVINNIDAIENVVDCADEYFDFYSPVSVFFELLFLMKNGKHAECVFVMKLCEVDEIYSEFINAQLTIKDYKFVDAIISLKALLSKSECPFFLRLLCLSSIENCCKLCEDYKGAYENHMAYQAMLAEIK